MNLSLVNDPRLMEEELAKELQKRKMDEEA